MQNELILSTLPKTWLIDLDGTVLEHNGYKKETGDQFLDNALLFLKHIPDEDQIIFLTSRTEEFREQTERILQINDIRYNLIIFGLPYGERILINDKKNSGLNTAIAVNLERDQWKMPKIKINKEL